MVPAVLFLRDGGEPIRQRSELLDIAYGVHHPGSEWLGDSAEGMEWGEQKDEGYDHGGDHCDTVLGDTGGVWKFT